MSGCTFNGISGAQWSFLFWKINIFYSTFRVSHQNSLYAWSLTKSLEAFPKFHETFTCADGSVFTDVTFGCVQYTVRLLTGMWMCILFACTWKQTTNTEKRLYSSTCGQKFKAICNDTSGFISFLYHLRNKSFVSLVFFKADNDGSLLHVSAGDDSLCGYAQSGTPLGGLHHRWSSRVDTCLLILFGG